MDSRAPEIEDYSNLYVFHPIAHALARGLSKTPVHPNLVSLAGVYFGVLAGINYYHFDVGNSALWAFFYMLVWHVLDGTDGQLARLTGKATAAGRAIDGLADHLVYFAVYIGMAYAVYDQGNTNIIWIVWVAGASHAVQASMLDRERQTYRFWVYSGLAGSKPKKPSIPKNPFLKGLHVYFQFIANMFDSNEAVKQLAYEKKVSADQKKKAAKYYQDNFVGYVHGWSILSPNAHTLAIFVFAYIGQPFYYFLFEIFAMNIILFILLQAKKKKDATFCKWMERVTEK